MKKTLATLAVITAGFTGFTLYDASTPAEAAGSWYRQSCTYEAGTGWVGVYRSGYGGGNYTKILVFRNYCPFSVR